MPRRVAAYYKEGSIDARGGHRAGSGGETPEEDPLDPPLPLRGVAACYKESSIDTKGGRRASSSKETP